MTVGQLRTFLKNKPSGMDIVVPGSDHSYLVASATVVRAERLKYERRGYGDPEYAEHDCGDDNSERAHVVVIQ